MRELKTGDLVYSKEYGQGIVFDARSLVRKEYEVSFENRSRIKTVKRETLFAKGDVVISSFGYIKEYYGYSPFTRYKFVVSPDKDNIGSQAFETSIDHYIEHKIDITVKVNGEVVSLSDLSVETLLAIRNNE